jgi:hypothetical protein
MKEKRPLFLYSPIPPPPPQILIFYSYIALSFLLSSYSTLLLSPYVLFFCYSKVFKYILFFFYL